MAGTRRIVEFAFDYARQNGRRKVTSVHKANIMKYTDGLWLEVSRARSRPRTPTSSSTTGSWTTCACSSSRSRSSTTCWCCRTSTATSSRDLGAGLVGGLGVAPGANFGTAGAVFEPTHGSAPQYKGQNKVNPIAMMLSGVLMLRHLEERAAADALEGAIAAVIAEGKVGHLRHEADAGRSRVRSGTSQVADAIIEQMGVRA